MPIETVDLVSSQAVTEREEVDSLPEIFWENTKLRPRAGIEAAVRRIQWFFADPRKVQSSRQSYKTYATVPWTVLPEPHRERPPLPRYDEVVLGRRSAVLSGTGAVFAEEPVPLATLGDLLYYSYGVLRPEAARLPAPVQPAANGNGAAPENDPVSPDVVADQKARAFAAQPTGPGGMRRRSAPSGGALFPLELYVVAVNVEGLTPGVYHYNTLGHHLEQLGKGTRAEVEEQVGRLLTAGLNYEGVAAVLVVTAVPLRTVFKYGDRGYRLLLVEAGHAAQNTYLAASALGVSVCAIAGFYDDEVNRALGVNGLDEFAAHVLVLGLPREAEEGAAP
ncbi:MAG TPA: SagB family peptide dehydrogenase [Longimicrobiaceae bacterium]|nr:SagB family peptide dehydrogenase [Longimicrobiaceae bacterium]